MKKQVAILSMIGIAVLSTAYASDNASSTATCNSDGALTNVPITDISTLLANSHGNSSANRLSSAQSLGWVNDPHKVCGGYFADPYIPGSSIILPPLKSSPVTISANSSALQYSGTSTLSGNVEITQPGRVVTADQANVLSDNGDYQRADLQGNVLLREAGKVATGQSAQIDLKNQEYSIQNVIYRLFLGSNAKSLNDLATSSINATTTNSSAPLSAWGKASSVVQPPSGITQLKNVTYSTCPPGSQAWDLEANHLDLNQETGRGYAYDAVLYAQGVPILYTPYFDFPIDNRRQSGFLYPQFSFGSESGLGLGLPYYWNIAPNMDDTITPYFYAKRGFAINNLYRYLTSTSSGSVNATLLPNDREFSDFQQTEPYQVPSNTPGLNDLANASSTRSFASWQDKTQFDQDWAGSVNYTHVSDDYFLQDIGNVPVAAQNQLLQQGQVTYTADTWNFLGNLQNYQTLHPVNEAVVENQYSMLPQLLFTSHLPMQANAFNYQWLTELVNFVEAPNPGEAQTPPSGQRVNFVPGISLPLSNAYGYITPALQLELTQYNLGDQPEGFADEITRAVPITNIDSGLFFERETNFFNNNYEQTLEPRIYYLYVPYHDQSDIPVFDSALQPFTFNQLFMNNRFTGSDRIGDADQVSFALSTRFLDQNTGDEKFSAGVGIISYFEDRRVTLCSTADCVDSPYTVGSTSTTEPTSPIVGQATYHFNPVWNASVNAAWDPNNAQTQNATFNFQYMPLPNHIFNVGYNFVRYGDLYTLPSNIPTQVTTTTTTPEPSSEYNLSEPTTSFAWPINDKWSVLGSWSYSWNQNHALSYFSGVQYDSCCWSVQVVMARTLSGLNAFGEPQYNNGVFVQWAFKGLAKVAANDPTALLLSNIPGYKDNFSAV